MPPESEYWFRAKKYGWGWGLPLKWQGWAVLIAFFALLAAGNVWLLMLSAQSRLVPRLPGRAHRGADWHLLREG